MHVQLVTLKFESLSGGVFSEFLYRGGMLNIIANTDNGDRAVILEGLNQHRVKKNKHFFTSQMRLNGHSVQARVEAKFKPPPNNNQLEGVVTFRLRTKGGK